MLEGNKLHSPEADLPAWPLLLAALMLPLTLARLGLVNRSTTRNKLRLASFHSTCTITLTSLCRGGRQGQATDRMKHWMHIGVGLGSKAVAQSQDASSTHCKPGEEKKKKTPKRRPLLTVTARLRAGFVRHCEPCS